MNKKMVFVTLAAVAILALGSLGVAYATSLNGRVFGGSKAGIACQGGRGASQGCQMQGAQSGSCPMQNNASGSGAAQGGSCPMGNAGSAQASGGCCAAN